MEDTSHLSTVFSVSLWVSWAHILSLTIWLQAALEMLVTKSAAPCNLYGKQRTPKWNVRKRQSLPFRREDDDICFTAFWKTNLARESKEEAQQERHESSCHGKNYGSQWAHIYLGYKKVRVGLSTIVHEGESCTFWKQSKQKLLYRAEKIWQGWSDIST